MHSRFPGHASLVHTSLFPKASTGVSEEFSVSVVVVVEVVVTLGEVRWGRGGDNNYLLGTNYRLEEEPG